MSPPQPNLYAQLRARSLPPPALHDGRICPAELLLQAIWQHQRLHRNKLKTVAGQRVFILHPGFLNREAGPDFLRAIVQFGDSSPQTGDIEVDPQPSDWRHHKHHRNPAYENVILHVVWTASNGADPADLPVLELKPVLDDSPANLSAWLHQDTPPELPLYVHGKCAAPLRDLTPAQLETVLTQAALIRFEGRAEQLTARAREAGWTQSLWEGLFRALGYKHNSWPMLRLAEVMPRWHRPNTTSLEATARLLGLSGLLPSELPAGRRAGSTYLRQLWDCWWREQDGLADCILPSGIWQLAGVRPANHPHRRLALAAHWVCEGTIPERLREWSQGTWPDTRLPESLMHLFRVNAAPYWRRHYTLRSKPAAKPVPLLGADQITVLAANVVLPWLWAIAREGKRTAMCEEVQRRFLAWPAGADNAVLKLARQRLLGSRKTTLPPRVPLQQGLHQIVNDFCDRSNSLCEGCAFPEVVGCFKDV